LKTRLMSPLFALLLAAPSFAASTTDPAAPAPSVPETIAAPRPDDAMGVTITRLPNGLTVYLSPSKGRPRISAWIATRAGSKNDPADSTGMAHYLEHMMFKGSTKLGTLDYAKEAPHLDRIRALYEARFKTPDAAARAKIDKQIDAENIAAAASEIPNEIDKFYRSIGGRGLNAFTSNEETVFHVDLPDNRLEAWATVEAERFEHPVFRLFPTEIEAVYEEKNRSLDNAAAVADEELQKDLYKAHPYGIPTLGTIAHLKNPSLTKMYAFHDRWYVPNNMAIALAGDFDRAKALEIIQRHFGGWAAKPLPPLPVWPLPKPQGVERHEVKYEAEEQVVVAWPTAPSSSPDADALEIMDMLMDNSAAGLLNLRLNQELKVKASGSYPQMQNDAGAWQVWAQPKKGQTPEEAESLLMQTVDALKNGEFTDEDIAANVVQFEIAEKRRLESNEGRAAKMIQSFVSLEPWQRTASHLDRLRRVTKDDVVRVARKYLGDDRVVVYRRNAKPEIPRIEKPDFTKLSIDPSRQSEFLKEALALPAPPIEPRWLVSGKDYQVVPVSGGKLYTAKNPYNDLFTLTVREERGRKHERHLCEALDLLDLAGAGPYPADEFKKRLYALGTTVWYSCGERGSEVGVSGLDRNFWPSLELLAERFDWPNVSSGTLERMVDVEIGARADEKLDPDAVSGALGELAQRGRESEVLSRPTNDELKKLDETRLKALIQDWPAWQRRVSYAGPRSASEVAKLLEHVRTFKPAPAREPLTYLKPPKTRLLFTHRAMEQAQVGFFAADEVYNPDDYVDYQFFSQYMGGGMSSVIFQEVREARALAYDAGGGHTTSAHKGDETRAWAELGCQADKTPEAVELMLKLFREFPSSTKRFEETAKAVEEGYRTNVLEYGEIPGALMDWEDQGLTDGDPRPKRFERALKYTLPEVESFSKRFSVKPMTVWILGDRDHVGADRLKALGDFEEKGLSDLFPY
jgi:predicted Zn-dependent peptidase